MCGVSLLQHFCEKMSKTFDHALRVEYSCGQFDIRLHEDACLLTPHRKPHTLHGPFLTSSGLPRVLESLWICKNKTGPGKFLKTYIDRSLIELEFVLWNKFFGKIHIISFVPLMSYFTSTCLCIVACLIYITYAHSRGYMNLRSFQ